MPNKPLLNPIQVLRDPRWLGPWFKGPSWDTWEAIVRATFCLPMSIEQLALFKAVSGDRSPPKRRVKELFVLAGRRSGKDSIASALATIAASFTDYRDRLRPGEKATILCLAVDRAQARIVLDYIRAYFQRIPALKELVVSERDELLELNNGTEIIVASNNFRSIRGKTFCVVIFDEVCYWRDENFANPDREVYESVMPGFATLHDDALLIGISTPYQRAGLAYEKWERSYGKDDSNTLIIQAPTLALNPTLDKSSIDTALERDPERAKAEWLAEWRDHESSFLPAQLIQSAVDPGVYARRPDFHMSYVGFVDAAGGAGRDSFCACVAHSDNGTIFVDAIFERTPPFSPAETTSEIASLFHEYNVHTILGDRFAGGWPVEAFSQHAITYEQSKLNRSELYQNCISLFTSGRVRLLDNQKLVDQFSGLRRKTQPGGREEINHANGAHDDLSNAAAGAIYNSLEADDPSVQAWVTLIKRSAEGQGYRNVILPF